VLPGTYEVADALCSEPLEYLSSLYNGELRPVRLPEGDIGHYLPYRRVSFGAQTVELAAASDLPRRFVGLVSIKEYPGHTAPGMLDELLRLPVELTISQSFAFVDRRAALGRVNLALRRMRAADDEALSLRGELAIARNDVASGRGAFGNQPVGIRLLP
jgi:type IV secretion system protein VirB4